ncbi:alpha/beta hydrolase [Mycolicibacterium litorale]|uniref:Acetylhydrolase n=1 Tax=Mycolicibacterium litorale TaxID=758802 RepID=A0AAD1ILA2_9MYCO|nr:alpha/beta hydrolase [Mycolicibacterium litorale]MCV7416208.1 alpha/beta hydrolase [Mycolicibacterium litorale]TDY09459.1 acetyl esterase/lipase [Mycolicibacterium litorale]BBY17405.1 acetylhydrolase [Mycolicibacterium litorale]
MPAQGSLRSRTAATVSGLTLRQISAVLPPEQAWGLWLSRQIVARIMAAFGPSLSGVRVDPVDTHLTDGRRLIGEWVRGRGVPTGAPDRALYYVHGSGYALCSPRTHRRLTGWLSAATGLPVFTVDYRLAPRHRFPTAADDVRAGWDWLIDDLGVPPGRMVIAGDSAGGHLTVDLLLQTATAHPAALVLLSPLIDLTFTRARERELLRRDPAIRSRDAIRLVELYCAAEQPTHPRLTLDVVTGRRLPPTLIQAGGAEMLAGDAIALADDIRAAGGSCELQVWPDQVHVFQALPRLAPEAVPAMREITAFVADALSAGDADRAVS